MRLNVVGSFIRARGGRGRHVGRRMGCVTDVLPSVATRGAMSHTRYVASKSAIMGALSFAREFGFVGIAVGCIRPGGVATGFCANSVFREDM